MAPRVAELRLCPPTLTAPKPQRALVVGALGNSITAGVDVRRNDAWPSQLQGLHNKSLNVFNRAIRASRADFAALCFDELFDKRSVDRLDLAIADYTFTSDGIQIGALHDRLSAIGVPSIGLLYCPHVGWQRFLHCGLDTNGYCRPANKSSEAIGSTTPWWERSARDWHPATLIRNAGSRYPGRGHRPGFDRSLGGLPIAPPPPPPRRSRTPPPPPPRYPERVEAVFATLTRLGLDSKTLSHAQRFFEAGLQAAASPASFSGLEGALVSAAAASFNRGKLNRGTTDASALLRNAVEGGTIDGFGPIDPVRWLDAISAVAAGACITSAEIGGVIRVLTAKGIPYTTNAAQLSLLAEEVLARKGGWGAHPSKNGHRLMATAVDELIEELLHKPAGGNDGFAACTAKHGANSVYPEQVCSYGEAALNVLLVSRSGFATIESKDGRTGGLVATTSGASITLRLTSRTLAAGYISIGYERGWRNVALARLDCVLPCQCRGIEINATNPKPYTGTSFTQSVWATLSKASGVYECVLRVQTTACESGRILLQAATLSAPLPGNRSIGVKDSLEIARYEGYGTMPFR